MDQRSVEDHVGVTSSPLPLSDLVKSLDVAFTSESRDHAIWLIQQKKRGSLWCRSRHSSSVLSSEVRKETLTYGLLCKNVPRILFSCAKSMGDRE